MGRDRLPPPTYIGATPIFLSTSRGDGAGRQKGLDARQLFPRSQGKLNLEASSEREEGEAMMTVGAFLPSPSIFLQGKEGFCHALPLIFHSGLPT